MDLSHRISQNVCIVDIKGDIVGLELPALQYYINTLLDIANLKAILLNMVDVSLIDGAGITNIIIAYSDITRRQINFAVCQPSGYTKLMLEITSFREIIPVYETEQEAIQHLSC